MSTVFDLYVNRISNEEAQTNFHINCNMRIFIILTALKQNGSEIFTWAYKLNIILQAHFNRKCDEVNFNY